MATSGRAFSSDTTVYPLAAEGGGAQALESLEGSFSTRREPTSTCRRLYFDTFDWRLYRQGLTLCSRVLDGRTALELTLAGDRLESRLANGALPAFAADLPAGAMRARIAPLIEARRLLPLAQLETTGQILRVLDDQEKTVARVVVELEKNVVRVGPGRKDQDC